MIGVTDHGHDQSWVQVDRDPDVYFAPVNDAVACHGTIDLGKLAQKPGKGFALTTLWIVELGSRSRVHLRRTFVGRKSIPGIGHSRGDFERDFYRRLEWKVAHLRRPRESKDPAPDVASGPVSDELHEEAASASGGSDQKTPNARTPQGNGGQ